MAGAGIIMKYSLVQSQDCKTLYFKDLTGEYDINTNPNGYPASAFDPTYSATLTFTLPDGTIVVLDITADGFFTIDTAQTLEINSETLGLTVAPNPIEALPDGIYTVKYKATFANTTTKFVSKKLVYICQKKCCVQKLFEAQLDAKSYCDNDELINALYAASLIESIEYEAGCGSSTTKINEMLESLEDICDSIGCGCGC